MAGLVIAGETAGLVRRQAAALSHGRFAGPVRPARDPRVAVLRAGAHLRRDDGAHRRSGGPDAGGSAGRPPPSDRSDRQALRALSCRRLLLSSAASAHRGSRARWCEGCSPTTSCATWSTWCRTIAATRASARARWFAASAGSLPSPRSPESRREPAGRGRDDRPHSRAARPRRLPQLPPLPLARPHRGRLLRPRRSRRRRPARPGHAARGRHRPGHAGRCPGRGDHRGSSIPGSG